VEEVCQARNNSIIKFCVDFAFQKHSVDIVLEKNKNYMDVIYDCSAQASWPPLSPHLSPIENLMAILQQRVDTHGPPAEKELWNTVEC